MKKLWMLLLVLCLVQGAAAAALPAGVAEVDLRAVLGVEALQVEDAWLLDAGTCVLLRNRGEWSQGDYEILVLDLAGGGVLGRAPVPGADFFRRQSVEDGVCTLWFTRWDARESEESPPPYALGPDECVRAAVSPEGAVEVTAFPLDWTTVMPGGETAVRTGEDGSLYALDLASGAEELLVQGVSARDMYREDAAELAARYQPFRDELPDAPEGPEFEYGPFVPDGSYGSIREFYVVRPLDAHRFLYQVLCWEWGAGFGIYDLETRTDHRITGRGFLMGMAGDRLYGEVLGADIHTYESAPLPEGVQDALQKSAAAWWGNDISEYAFSPDGTWMAHLWRREWGGDEGPGQVTLIDLRSGDILRTYALEREATWRDSLSVAPEGRVLLFCRAAEEGGAPVLRLMEGPVN